MTLTLSIATIGGLLVAAVGGWALYTSSVEQPSFALMARDGPVEVRDYPELVVAEVATVGDRWEAVRQGFRPLARYIFARERRGGGIAMTAPVTQSPTGGGDGVDAETWVVRFIMPSAYTLEGLPAPANADVRLDRLPAARRAAIRFSGVATDDLLAIKTVELRGWMLRHGLVPNGSPTFAYYNDPWTPGFLRRNEVLFDIAQD